MAEHDAADFLSAWRARQPTEVRAELDRLLAYQPERAFLEVLAGRLPVVPASGLIDLYYDIFYCCPVVFTAAVDHLHTPEALAEFLALAERALLEPADVDAFMRCRFANDIDEIIAWLTRRAARRG